MNATPTLPLFTPLPLPPVSIFLITLEVLVNQVRDLVQKEQAKQSWVTVSRGDPAEGGRSLEH